MECIVQNSMEQDRRVWNTLETTVSYKAWARLTPTLTHVVAYELATSGAEDGAMSHQQQAALTMRATIYSPGHLLGPHHRSSQAKERKRLQLGLKLVW